MKPDVTAAWRWFSAEDALRWALAAYYAACRAIEPPADDPEPETWAHGGVFVDEFHRALTLRLNAEAETRGIPSSGSASELLGWNAPENAGWTLGENRPQNAVAEDVKNAG